MISDFREAYVWVWLPEQSKPVVAGRLYLTGERFAFHYGRSYLDRVNAMPLSLPELPLRRGEIAPLPGLSLAGCLRDGAPDAWGRRVIMNRLYGGKDADVGRLDELAFLLLSGSDRPGALDFQLSASDYVPRDPEGASLAELQEASALIEAGKPLSATLDKIGRAACRERVCQSG